MRTRPFTFTALLVFLAACSGEGAASTTTQMVTTTTSIASTTSDATTTTTEAATAAPTTTVQNLLIEVEGGLRKVGPDTITVQQGETVFFQVLTDAADEIHVHGYDLLFDAVAETAVTVEFVADATGIFEVELEGAQVHLTEIEVTP